MSEKNDKKDDDELVETEIVESASADFVNLLNIEEADAQEGVVPVRIIGPGWGTSGYYSPDTLTAAAQEGAFDNAHMNWDHISQGERPERSALKWAGSILEGSAEYQKSGSDGPGVYGQAFIFPHWREAVESMKTHIGLSIIGSGKSKYGTKDGKSGPIFESLAIRDVDFVTRPGAGGKIAKQFQGFKESKPPTETDAEESESNDMPPKDKPKGASESDAPAVESVVAEAIKENDKKWDERFKKLEESQRTSGRLETARAIVNESSLPSASTERVMSLVSSDVRMAEESADAAAIAKEVIEAELKYIEQITPLHLRRPDLEEAMDDDKFEKSMAEAEAAIFSEPLGTDKE